MATWPTRKIEVAKIMSSKNTEKKQVFKSLDAFSVLGVASLVAYILVYIIGNNSGDQSRRDAELEMETLTSQILALGMKNLPSPTRGIASVEGNKEVALQWNYDWEKVGNEGKIGKDTWGQPYHYRVFKDTSNRVSHILMISGGPDGKIDTALESLDSIKVGENLNIPYQNDDFGFIKNL